MIGAGGTLRTLTGVLLGAATLGTYGAVEARRLRAVPILPSMALGLDIVVPAHDIAVPAAVHEGAVHLAVLGDSVAAGVGPTEVAGSFPYALAARVATALGRPVRVRSLGVSGARVADVAQAQLPRLAAGSHVPDVAVLSVGVNDVTHVTPPWRFAAQLETVLSTCRAAGTRPVVTGLPDFRALAVLSPPLRYVGYALGERVHRLQRDVTGRIEGAEFVDVKAAAGPAFRRHPELLAEDGFHPSAGGCACLADAVAPAVVDAVRARAV